MNLSALLSVELNGKVVEQGTAFLHREHVVTAFHVVGSTESGLWRHDFESGVEYQLISDGCVRLQPVLANTVADVALLCPTSPPNLLSLNLTPSAAAVEGRQWRTVAFPPEVDEGAYALNGVVTHVHSWWDARSMQLLVEQGTNVDWGGISGAPVIVDDQIAGLVTTITPQTSTAWACTAVALLRLLRTVEADLLSKVALLLRSALHVPQELTDFLPESHPAAIARWYVERWKVADLISSIGVVSKDDHKAINDLLEMLDGHVPTSPVIWTGSTVGLHFFGGSGAAVVPDLLTPSHGDRAGELRRLFGDETGGKLDTLSTRALNAIEYGQFEAYVEVGREMQLTGQLAGIQQLIGDGTSLAADGHRLLAGFNIYEQSGLLLLAKQGFEQVLDLMPDDHRAQRGLACCAQAEFDFGSALHRLNLAIDGIRRRIVTPGAMESDSRRLGDRHELLRLVRHRIDVILRIRASSPQNYWKSEVGTNALTRLVADHEHLFRTTMNDLTARADWYHFECFASLTFLADAWFELGNVDRAKSCALAALGHRRTTIRQSPSDVQLANLNWWLSACRGRGLNQEGWDPSVEQLADAVRRGDNADVVLGIDHILSIRR
jgi:hypothetical protein